MILRQGDIGAAVGDLQRRLFALGYKIDQTSVYDARTVDVIKQVQKRARLVVDGIYGPKTDAAMRGQKTGLLLRQSTLQEGADELGVDLASVLAVNEVESRGLGFVRDGMPIILFERHIFWRQLVAHNIDPKPLSTKYPGIVSQSRGGYAGGMSEYTRLSVARSIFEPAALESCSWGLFQIMGFHWRMLGFESVEAFVDYQSAGEDNQFRTFVRFVKSDANLHKALVQKKWANFAKLYNGPAYADNLYDVKLSRAYQRYAEIEVAAA